MRILGTSYTCAASASWGCCADLQWPTLVTATCSCSPTGACSGSEVDSGGYTAVGSCSSPTEAGTSGDSSGGANDGG